MAGSAKVITLRSARPLPLGSPPASRRRRNQPAEEFGITSLEAVLRRTCGKVPPREALLARPGGPLRVLKGWRVRFAFDDRGLVPLWRRYRNPFLDIYREFAGRMRRELEHHPPDYRLVGEALLRDMLTDEGRGWLFTEPPHVPRARWFKAAYELEVALITAFEAAGWKPPSERKRSRAVAQWLGTIDLNVPGETVRAALVANQWS